MQIILLSIEQHRWRRRQQVPQIPGQIQAAFLCHVQKYQVKPSVISLQIFQQSPISKTWIQGLTPAFPEHSAKSAEILPAECRPG